MNNTVEPGLILAGAGNDTLTGTGHGLEIFVGGLGRDVMQGGDRYYGAPFFGEHIGADDAIGNGAEIEAVGAERDLVLNFTANDGTGATSDRIHLGLIDANTARAGNQAFSFIGAADFSGTAGELRVSALEGTDHLLVAADTNGDGLADFEIEVQTEFGAPLSAADFIH